MAKIQQLVIKLTSRGFIKYWITKIVGTHPPRKPNK